MTSTHGQNYEKWDIVHSVGMTALAVAAGRAVETNRSRSLIEDPYAERFVRAANAQVSLPTSPEAIESEDSKMGWMWGFLGDHMAMRTHYLDEFLEQSAAAGITQAVVLAAGLDARAFRLDWPAGFQLFEVDQPKVLDFKNEVLEQQDAAPGCARSSVRADLREDWVSELNDAGFDPSRPTAWLAEGLLPYLPPEAEQRLLELVHERSAPGSRIALEAGSPNAFLGHPTMEMASESFGVDLHQLLHDDDRPSPESALAELGWTTTLATKDELSARYERRSEDSSVDDLLRSQYFVIAERPR